MKFLLSEIFPIESYDGKCVLDYSKHRTEAPKLNPSKCIQNSTTYSSSLYVTFLLKQGVHIKEEEVFMGELPLMTPQGTFVINGVEKVVLNQLHRAPGMLFESCQCPNGKLTYSFKIIPQRGAWLECEFGSDGIPYVYLGHKLRKYKFALVLFLRAMGYINAELRLMLPEILWKHIEFKTTEQALREIYRQLRPKDPCSAASARALLKRLFFDPKRYDLSPTGRYIINKKLGLSSNSSILSKEDLTASISYLLSLREGKGELDDINSLEKRYVKTSEMLLREQYRIAFTRIALIAKQGLPCTAIKDVIATQILGKTLRTFFNKSPLVQLLDKTNKLAELVHKQRLSALGPGGLSGDRTGFEVRDVHPSHYGRICPIETSEGSNVGLVLTPTLGSKINELGFIEPAPDGQITGLSASLIPFLEHDDANRALMGCNMMRQALPLEQPESPTIATGIENKLNLKLGKNVLVAFMPWNGYNFQDAILVSERLIRDNVFTNLHTKTLELIAHETKFGPEEITNDIPDVDPKLLAKLESSGVIKIGTDVKPGDILVGKITPKPRILEVEMEDRIIQSIFGTGINNVKNTSLVCPIGVRGIVTNVQITVKRNSDKKPAIKSVKLEITERRKLCTGDKLANRHGNKGVVAKIAKIEDMPHMEDGTPIDIVLNPLGVISRMNIGQILETHLGWTAYKLKRTFNSPAFKSISTQQIQQYLRDAGLPESGKTVLIDGQTGQPFDQEVTVGCMYVMKLDHLVADKIHARATGPYSFVTQQPLSGRAHHGGQRIGEMEVWALEAYGASHALQEFLTVKSDDIKGRVEIQKDIFDKGNYSLSAHTPESFNVLVNEIKALGLDIRPITEEKDEN